MLLTVSPRVSKQAIRGQSDGLQVRFRTALRHVRRIIARFLALTFVLAFAGLAEGSTAPGSRAARIRDFANRWLGTPYAWGGDSKAGIDCSGYLRQMFRELFNVELPRTT